MANTYQLINSNTVGSGGVSSVTFSSIPATYTDLKVVASARTNASNAYNDWIVVSYNGSTTSLSFRELEGIGTSAASYSGSSGLAMTANTSAHTANTFSNADLYLPNYAGSNNKSYSADGVTENNGTDSHQTILAGLWANSAAITSIALTPNSGTLFVQYSTFYLYGIKNS